MTGERPFLTVQWRHLAMLNYEVDPALLAPRLPHGIDQGTNAPGYVEYGWTSSKSPGVLWRSGPCGVENHLWVEAAGGFRDLCDGEEAEFITEHYWGYTRHRNGNTWEYRVEHPRWRVADVRRAGFQCDVAALYGPEFSVFLSERPSSSLLAEGSPVTVYQGTRIHP